MNFGRRPFALLALALASTACSTTHVVEEKAPMPVIPDYVKVPHPAGFDLVDLKAILVSPLAPHAVRGEFADTCDEEFKKLTSISTLKEERDRGALELVKQDPERMHWCFYAKIARLQDSLQADTTWSQRQKKVIESFEFLSPIAGAFLSNYHDSRYLRWAAQYYSKVSEWVFFKKLQPSPENSMMLTNGTRSEAEPWISVQRNESKPTSVFSKYGIAMQPAVNVPAAKANVDVPTRAPASVKPVAEDADLDTQKPTTVETKAAPAVPAEADKDTDPTKAWSP